MDAVTRTAEGYEYNGVKAESGLLSPQESRVLVVRASGASIKETARVVGVTPNTVTRYSQHIFYKLKSTNMQNTVLNASRLGILRLMVFALISVVEFSAITTLTQTGDHLERPVGVRARARARSGVRTRSRRETEIIIH